MTFDAEYTDGHSAARRNITVTVSHSELTLTGEDGGLLERWPIDRVLLAEEVFSGRPIRLRQAGSEAQITVRDPGLIPQLRRAAPHLSGDLPGGKSTSARIVLAVASLLVVAVVVVLLALRSPPILVHLVPVSWEAALGRQFIEAQPLAWCSGAEGLAVLSTLGQRLQQSAATPFPITIRVSGTDAINAVTAPGGQIIVFRGLLEFADGPDELVGVLAHEVAHAAARHPMQGLIRNAGLSLVVKALIGGRAGGDLLSNVGKNLVLLANIREAELQADQEGLELLNRAGIRSIGMARFLNHMKSKQGDVPQALSYFSTHPMHADRIALLRGLQQDGDEPMTPEDWKILQRVCD